MWTQHLYIFYGFSWKKVIKEPQCPSRCPVRTIKQDMSVQSVYLNKRGGGGGGGGGRNQRILILSKYDLPDPPPDSVIFLWSFPLPPPPHINYDRPLSWRQRDIITKNIGFPITLAQKKIDSPTAELKVHNVSQVCHLGCTKTVEPQKDVQRWTKYCRNVSNLTDILMHEGGKFLKKLGCCVGGRG